MDAPRRPSIHELTEESERTRAELAQTLAALRSNVQDTTANIQTVFSPAYMKKEAKGWIRERGDSFYHSFEQKIRENPLQAAAAGAAVAYPLWGLLRSVPAPLMLIAAGFWLAKRQTSAPSTEEVVDRYRSEVAPDLTESPSIVGDLTDQLGQAVQQARDAATDKVEKIYSAAGESVSQAASQTSEMFSQASRATADALRSTQAKASELGNKSRKTVVDFVTENPLGTAGVGLAIGAIIAAALPSTRTERRAVSPLRRRAEQAAAMTMDRAQDTARETVRRAREAAEREGLTAERMGQNADALTGKVRTVAERGLETALGGNKQNEQRPLEKSGDHHE